MNRSVEPTASVSERGPAPGEDAQTLIFLHLPKTAGVSLNAVLERNYGRRRCFVLPAGREAPLEAFSTLPLSARLRYKVVSGHRIWGIDRFTRSPSAYLTLLRDPRARAISQYLHVRRNADHFDHEFVLSRNLGVGDYIASGVNARLDNCQTRDIAGDMSTPFGESASDLLETAKANLDQRFSSVGLTEQFDESLLLFAARWGWKDLRYLKLNTRRAAEEVSLSDQDEKVIERYTELDEALYEYAKDRFRRELAQFQEDDPSFEEALATLRQRSRRHAGWRMMARRVSSLRRRSVKLLRQRTGP